MSDQRPIPGFLVPPPGLPSVPPGWRWLGEYPGLRQHRAVLRSPEGILVAIWDPDYEGMVRVYGGGRELPAQLRWATVFEEYAQQMAEIARHAPGFFVVAQNLKPWVLLRRPGESTHLGGCVAAEVALPDRRPRERWVLWASWLRVALTKREHCFPAECDFLRSPREIAAEVNARVTRDLCRWGDAFRLWRQIAACCQGHFFAGPFPLGWKELLPDRVGLVSPVKRTIWSGRELWADRYNPEGPAMNEPGIHAWSFWAGAHHYRGVLAFALVAPLGHVTLGDESWRAEGAALLRVWAHAPEWVIAQYREQYGVPVQASRSPWQAGLSWAARCLEKGETIAPELDELAF